MTFAVHCHECEATAWPPVEAGGSAGRSEIAARTLALEHVRETGHTEVYVTAGCYYVGDGERPNTLADGESITAADVARSDAARLAATVEGAAEKLEEAAEKVAEIDAVDASITADHLDRYADAVRSHVRGGSDPRDE